jgi:hypothetical protein
MELFAFVAAVQREAAVAILCHFNALANSMPVEVIDQGDDKMHAEMRLLRKQLDSGSDVKHYIGISKLCCGFCNFALQQFGALHVPLLICGAFCFCFCVCWRCISSRHVLDLRAGRGILNSSMPTTAARKK